MKVSTGHQVEWREIETSGGKALVCEIMDDVGRGLDKGAGITFIKNDMNTAKSDSLLNALDRCFPAHNYHHIRTKFWTAFHNMIENENNK